MAFSSSSGYSLVGDIAYRLYHGSWDGGRGGRSGLLLLSAASFANVSAAHFTCQYFLISLSSCDSVVTDSDSNQVGFLPHEKTGTEEKR